MTREELAVKLAKDDRFKALAPERRKAVFESASAKLQPEIEQPVAQEPPQGGFNPFALANTVQASVSGTGQQAFEQLGQTFGQENVGRTVQAALPFARRIPPSMAPAAVSEMVGGVAAALVDPLTYAFGGVGMIPNRMARAVLGTTLGATAPFTRGRPVSEVSPLESLLGGVAGGVGSALTRVTPRGIQLDRTKFPQGLVLTEDQLTKMTPMRRARYLEVQRIREETRLGRQIGHFEEQARLREAEVRAQAGIGEEAIARQQVFGKVQAEAQRDETLRRLSVQEQSHLATLDTQREGFEALLHETSKQKTVMARQPFFDAAKSHSIEYQRLIQNGLESPAAQRAQVTIKELDDLITQTFADDLQSERLARNTLSLLDDQTRVGYPFSPKEILNEIDSLGLQRGAYTKLRVYTNRERVADDLRSTLLDLLESKGVDFRTAKEYWRPWAQTRNRAIRLLRPFDDVRFPSYTGAQALEQVAKGMGPQEVVREIERELGVNLTDDVRQVVLNLQANERAKLLAKVSIEAQREEAKLLSARSISDYEALASRQTERIESVRSRKLANIQSETQAQQAMAQASSGRKLTRLEQMERQAIRQATRRETARRILKRSLFGLAAYGGAKQVPVLRDILP